LTLITTRSQHGWGIDRGIFSNFVKRTDHEPSFPYPIMDGKVARVSFFPWVVRDDRLARISLTSEVVHPADLVAMRGRYCFPRDETNAMKLDLKVLRGRVYLVAQPLGLGEQMLGCA